MASVIERRPLLGLDDLEFRGDLVGERGGDGRITGT